MPSYFSPIHHPLFLLLLSLLLLLILLFVNNKVGLVGKDVNINSPMLGTPVIMYNNYFKKNSELYMIIIIIISIIN